MVPAAANPSSSVDFRLLGPVTVLVGGQPVAIGGPRQMAVLARLMLTPDHVVTMNQLVESVWDGDEPARPDVAVRSYISNLRRAIEPHRRRRASDSCLASSPSGYRLAVDPASIDWIRFERLISDGRQQLATGDWGGAVLMFRHAHSLWAGLPFSGLPESPFFVAQQARLTDLRETAMELLFEALLAGGDHASVAAEVESAIAESPLRERLTELGMLALYRSGRQSEALALGQKLRARLLDKLGVDPSPSIDAIELKILTHDRSLEPLATPIDGPEAGPAGSRRTADGQRHDAPPQPAVGGTDPNGRPIPGRTTTGPIADAGAAEPATVADPAAGSAGGRGAAVDEPGAGLWGPHAGNDAPGGAARPAITPAAEAAANARTGDEAGQQSAPIGDHTATDGPGPGRDVTEPTGGPGPAAAALPQEAVPLGRRVELESLASVWATLRSGRSATVVMTGEQGMGKTTLARSLADSTAGGGAMVAWSRCVAEPTAPLWPWAQIVLALLDTAGDGALEPTTDLAPLAALGPSVAAALGLQPIIGSGQAEIMLAVTRLLERLADEAPVLLLFEDLQWADHESVALLSYAGSTLADRPVGFVATWRHTDIASGPTATAMRELSRLPTLIRLELEGLDRGAIRELARSVGRQLTAAQVEDVQRRSAGNPLFVTELLAHADMTVGQGRHWSNLTDTVLDRVERLHPMAIPVLEIAALFQGEFTTEGLAAVCEQPAPTVQEVLDVAVRSRVLGEDRFTPEAYHFLQPLIAEVLASKLLAATRAGAHGAIGHRLLETAGPGFEAAHHLSRSRSPEDRLLGARLALAQFHLDADGHRLAEMATYVRVGAEALRRLQAAGANRTGSDFELDALAYTSWRDWVDGRATDWLVSARRWLEQALTLCPAPPDVAAGQPTGATESEPAGPDPLEPHDPLERLERAILNIIGQPRQAVGPTSTADLITPSESDLELVAEAVDRLAAESPVRFVAQVHRSYLGGLNKPGLAGQTEVMGGARTVAAGAGKQVGPDNADSAVIVQQALLQRFHDVIEPEARLSMLKQISRHRPGRATDLFRIRYGYPAMLELGRTVEAGRRTEGVLHRAIADGDPLLVAEARLLWIRHLLWTGRLEAAEEQLESAMADWGDLGLARALPLVRQHRTLGLLQHRPPVDSLGSDARQGPATERAGPSEHVLWLARSGADGRANESLDALLETATVRHLSLADQALMAAAALVVGHEKAAVTAQELLAPYGDRLIVRSDGSVVIGPASLYAGLAARAAGDEKAASALIDSGLRAVQRFGGSAASADVVINHLRASGRSNPVPSNP